MGVRNVGYGHLAGARGRHTVILDTRQYPLHNNYTWAPDNRPASGKGSKKKKKHREFLIGERVGSISDKSDINLSQGLPCTREMLGISIKFIPLFVI